MPLVMTTLAISIVFCGLYLLLARRLQILDQPNERSSHTLPTPHGGGVAMLTAFAAGLVSGLRPPLLRASPCHVQVVWSSERQTIILDACRCTCTRLGHCRALGHGYVQA